VGVGPAFRAMILEIILILQYVLLVLIRRKSALEISMQLKSH